MEPQDFEDREWARADAAAERDSIRREPVSTEPVAIRPETQRLLDEVWAEYEARGEHAAAA